MRRRPCRRSPMFMPTVEKQAGVGNVWSLETLRRWLAEKAGSSDVATLKEYVNVIPEHLVTALHFRRSGCGGGVGPGSRSRFKPNSPRGREARSCAGRRAQEASGLRDRRHRSFGDCRAQQRQHDREAQPRADDRIRAGRDLHRAGVPFGGRDVLLHPAGHLPGGVVGHGAVAARRGTAIRQRRGADGVLWVGTERDDPFPQPAADWRQRPASVRNWRSSARPCWSVRR